MFPDPYDWIPDPRPDYPFRIKPRNRRGGDVISYRQCATLLKWCAETFGHTATLIECQSATFSCTDEMGDFILRWTGVTIPAISDADLFGEGEFEIGPPTRAIR